MSIPTYDKLMLPLLKTVSDGKEWPYAECIKALELHFKITEADYQIMIPSGRQPLFRNRVGWAKTYLKKAGLIEYPRRSIIKITDRGYSALKQNPAAINDKFLLQFPEYREFHYTGSQSRKGEAQTEPTINEIHTPEEQLAGIFENLRKTLSTGLMDEVRKCSPSFFERLVVDLLVKMGYGGSREDVGRALVVGKSGDGGIDGIIKEDRLGLDAIYVQAKRWENTVGRPQIQSFVGALHGRSSKGVFITTSSFSKEAEEYARSLGGLKIVLIDGDKLAELMIEHNLGVSTKQTYEIKKVDYDYFSEEE